MAVTQADFVEKTGAEVVGDRFVVGIGAKRRFVGGIVEGSFTLNEEGQELAAAIERGEDVLLVIAGGTPVAEEDKPAKPSKSGTKKTNEVA
ncbi:hypothetical protein ACO0LG_08740 [Undibacterium sp. Ji42W]|uniref:hypothetical protein n=1 Tax=Undibacterium sp. Ji42W TaxID=3413039 RepID=UPI003BF22CA4